MVKKTKERTTGVNGASSSLSSSSSSSSNNMHTLRVIMYTTVFNCVVLALYWNMTMTSSLSQLFYTDNNATATATAVSVASADADTADNNSNMPQEYVPSRTETYIVDHATELGYASEQNPAGCTIWKKNDNDTATSTITNELLVFQSNMDAYNTAIQNFAPIPDLLSLLIQSSRNKEQEETVTNVNTTQRRRTKKEICALARLHPEGLSAFFSNSNGTTNHDPQAQLSYTPTSGYLEPLLPPMRDPRICTNKNKYLMKLDYLIHDFEHMCQHLHPTSRRIFIDMGASLSFHGAKATAAQPVVTLLRLYEQFGFHFDHIYGFEITPQKPTTVYEQLLPLHYLPVYHWINVGVNHTVGHKLNPLHSILRHFNEEDFIVVKLDIDTSFIELPLAQQLLDGGKDGIYHKLVDQFYFEHHVHLGELAGNWKGSMTGSIKDSLELFQGLRRQGIPAHFWP